VPTLYDDGGPNGTLERINKGTLIEGQDSYKTKPLFLSGSAGLITTPTDFLRFAQMLLNGGELDGVRILSPKTVDLMTSDLLGDLPVRGAILPGYGFGYGVEVNRGPAKTATIGSAGEFNWTGAFGTLFFVDPKEQLIGIFMMQDMMQSRLSFDAMWQFKRMVYQAIVEEEKPH
jgi:CubicO group peptidase (beta-lactamase class C family)